MKKRSLFKTGMVALAVAGLFASSAVRAESLDLQIIDDSSFGVRVTANGVATTTTAGLLSATTSTGNSFLAFCFELLQGLAPLTAGFVTYTSAAVNDADTQQLFNTGYASLGLGGSALNYVQLAGFQVALWETQDDNNLATGNYQNWSSLGGGDVMAYAQGFLDGLSNPATGNYQLTAWTNPDHQDIIQATPGGNNVPEPATALLAALGLSGIALARRRKV